MAVILNEQDVAAGLQGSDKYWCYNALDVLVTEEVRQVLAGRLQADPPCDRVYKFEAACQSPAFAMMLRGTAIDEGASALAIKDWLAEEVLLTAQCCSSIGARWPFTDTRKGKCDVDAKPHRWSNALNLKDRVESSDADANCRKCGCSRLVGRSFNPLSAPQVAALCYDVLELPKQYSRKGERGVTTDDEALEKLIAREQTGEVNAQVLRNVLSVRAAHKQISFLRSRRSSDGRLRQSVNVGATETGRWSASKDPFREGTNFQNIADRSRNIIVADPGLWLFYADLEQAESRIVAYDAECEQDIEDHISGDTHTGLCRDLFPDLPWPNGLADKRVAQTPLPWDSTHDYRSVAKIVRHGTNIGMQGASIGREIHSDKKTGDRLREQYFERYPENLRRQKEIMAQVATTGILVTPVGRKRQFFGRLWDAGTQREGLAQTQQSTIADVLNLALWRIWKELDLGVNVMNAPRASDPNRVWLLAQVHDAILGLIRPHDITTLLRIKELMTVPIKIRGRVCTIPVEIFLGRNFRHFNPSQPKTIGGLAGWKIEGDKLRVFNTREDLK